MDNKSDIQPMENSEILLTVNALLVSLVGTGLSVLSFFLKDVYHDHKKLQDKVIALQQEVNTHHRLAQEYFKRTQQQMDHHGRTLDQLQYRVPHTEG